MSAPSGNAQGQHPVWIWYAANEKEDFVHPSAIPTDEATAKVRFGEGKRGPRLTRIRPATLLQTKGAHALVSENGVSREVPKNQMIPWYEGLLLLEELGQKKEDASYMKARWNDETLTSLLEKERIKHKGSLSSALYVERKLLHTSMTGVRFVDPKLDKEFAYRRDNVKGEDKSGLVEGEEAGGYYKIKEVLGYLPPWEAFLHEKCGFYQDFYQVKWQHPFADTDYSQVENGCAGATGSTWEPDECLPSCLDPLRLAAKKAWINRQKKTEQSRGTKRPAPAPAAVAPPPASKIQKTKFRKDGKPLDADSFKLSIGHDFTALAPEAMGDLRKGWPKNPGDYPRGYGVANPPGFCFEACDCMDDQRPQRSWETHKAWLEEPVRSKQALDAIEGLGAQVQFVRRRGQVSKMWYFETSNEKQHDMTHTNAASDLQGSLCRRIGEVMKALPVRALVDCPVPVFLPSLAYLKEDTDAASLRVEAKLKNGAPLPAWLTLNPESAILAATDESLQDDLDFVVNLYGSEGLVSTAACKVFPNHKMKDQPWILSTTPIINRFNDEPNMQLDRNVRGILQERFEEIYDFRAGKVKEVPLGTWLKVISTVIRMLRSTAVAHIVPPE